MSYEDIVSYTILLQNIGKWEWEIPVIVGHSRYVMILLPACINRLRGRRIAIIYYTH